MVQTPRWLWEKWFPDDPYPEPEPEPEPVPDPPVVLDPVDPPTFVDPTPVDPPAPVDPPTPVNPPPVVPVRPSPLLVVHRNLTTVATDRQVQSLTSACQEWMYRYFAPHWSFVEQVFQRPGQDLSGENVIFFDHRDTVRLGIANHGAGDTDLDGDIEPTVEISWNQPGSDPGSGTPHEFEFVPDPWVRTGHYVAPNKMLMHEIGDPYQGDVMRIQGWDMQNMATIDHFAPSRTGMACDIYGRHFEPLVIQPAGFQLELDTRTGAFSYIGAASNVAPHAFDRMERFGAHEMNLSSRGGAQTA